MTNEPGDLYEALFKPASSPKPKRRRSKRKDLEGPVVRECLLWLSKHPDVVLIERRSTGLLEFEDGSRISFGKPGAADIWCLVRVENDCYTCASHILVHVEIECKRRDGKGRLSGRQKSFKKLCNEADIPYLVVTSAENLAERFSNIS